LALPYEIETATVRFRLSSETFSPRGAYLG
jgi:hypothetical protein